MILILHHWDTDGICSAGLMMGYLIKSQADEESITNITPEIGKFSLSEEIHEIAKNFEMIFVVDLNLVEEVEKLYLSTRKPITFIDHHNQRRFSRVIKEGDLEVEVAEHIKQINPTLYGKEAISTTFVISSQYNFWNYLTAIGAIGDAGKRAFDNPTVKKLLKGMELDSDNALRIVELIDSNYIIMDKRGVEKAVRLLLKEDIKDLLENKEWNNNLQKIQREVSEIINNIKELEEGFAFVDFRSNMNIISKVARKIIWEMGYKKVIAINRGFDQDQIYIRSIKNDLTPLCNMLKERCNAGGKRDVIGAITNKNKTDGIKDMVIEWLKA